jgi:hypothetical protein
LAERKEKVIKLIYNNPGITGNELYKQARSQGYGIKKSDFYQTLRIVRKLPEPTIEEKRKATPIRYRKPEPKPITEIKDLPIIKKKGAYGIVFIEAEDDKGNEQEFWVKYETKKSVREQVDKIKKKYKIKIKKIIFKGLGSYAEYIDAEFEKLLKSVGIDI